MNFPQKKKISEKKKKIEKKKKPHHLVPPFTRVNWFAKVFFFPLGSTKKKKENENEKNREREREREREIERENFFFNFIQQKSVQFRSGNRPKPFLLCFFFQTKFFLTKEKKETRVGYPFALYL